MRRCKEHGKRWCVTCVLATIAFPIEHFLWEHTPLHRLLVIVGLG